MNIAGVPLTLVKAERRLGYESRLVTLSRHHQGREEDICLDLPLQISPGVQLVKRWVTPEHRRKVDNLAKKPETIPIQWHPDNWIESFLFTLREQFHHSKIDQAIDDYHLMDFDVYQLDGGLGFYRNGRIIQKLKSKGKQVICCYTGSDLRTRGVIPEIDGMSDLNVSVEFDHLQYHPNIHHVPFPLDVNLFQTAVDQPDEGDVIRIGHAPTSREAKGSDTIIPIVQAMEENYPIQLVLIEGLPYDQALSIKRSCHIFIDQIGDLGYGMNSLEALAMGIPTCSSLAPGFEDAYPDHPFIVIDGCNLKEKLIQIVKDRARRIQLRQQGLDWLKRVHDSISVVKKIHQLADISISSASRR